MGTPQRGSEIFVRLRQANRLLEELLAQCYAPSGISATRVDVLELLAHSLTCGSQTEVARTLGLSESTVCTLIERMQLDGLLVRQRSITDRRRSVLAMSERGTSVLHEAVTRRTERLHAAFGVWSAAEADHTCRTLNDIVATLGGTVTPTSSEPARLQERAA